MRRQLFGASVLAMCVAQVGVGRAQAPTNPADISPSTGTVNGPGVSHLGIEEVIVTATKREEKLQKVPLSIQVLDTKKLDQLTVNELQDYIKFLPSVSIQAGAPNQSSIAMRGVASGEDGNHSGPLPTVGTYLDELPVTTIGGTLDVHVYDIARVEVLPGPQGTLYGASSEAGTLRIITNKPTLGGLTGGYDLQGNVVDHGGLGGVAEGFVNIPIAPNAAVRLVAFDEHDSGYIDNVFGTRTYEINNNDGPPPTFTRGGTINNAAFVKNGDNPSDVFGGRAALRVDLDDNWSVTAQALGQDQRNTGTFSYEPGVGYLKEQRFAADWAHDRWAQAGLTISGRLGDYSLTYAGSLFLRDVHTHSDYTDYSIFYDAIAGSGVSWQDANGHVLSNPQQVIDGKDHYTKESNELRLASPSTDRLRFIFGAFQEIQTHRIVQDYQIQGFGPQISVPGWANTIWLTDQLRTDRDEAVFGEVSFDATPKFTVTGGVRPYRYDNSLKGFFGFSAGFSSHTGAINCIAGKSYSDAPCVDLDKSTGGSGETHKINLTYKLDPDRLVYFTYSTGYRPGGVNRNGNFGGYNADTLTNFELGLKSTWLDHRLLFNAALYDEDWNNFQFSFLGPSSLTIIENAPQANIKGLEFATDFRATSQLEFSGGATLTEAKLTKNFCGTDQKTNLLLNDCPNSTALAVAGTALPYTPSLKTNLTTRYTFDMMGWNGHLQGSLLYQTRAHVGLRTADNDLLGSMPAYATADFSAGIERNRLSIELFIKNAFNEQGQVNRYTPCTIAVCAADPSKNAGLAGVPQAIYVVPVQPLTVGIKLSQRF